MPRTAPRRAAAAAVVAAVALLTLAPVAAAAGRPADRCTNVAGTLSGVTTPVVEDGVVTGFHVVVTSATGDLGGTVTADLVLERSMPGGTLHVGGAHHFVDTAVGSFETSDRIVVTPGGVVHDTLRIVSGDVSGFLVTHGTVDLATGALELDYHGRVCSAP
ncbi:MAG TPA: hypothetical protein VGB14_13650 [Acidimicrobiales bacterium]|jgi:hypothetical protein